MKNSIYYQSSASNPSLSWFDEDTVLPAIDKLDTRKLVIMVETESYPVTPQVALFERNSNIYMP